jgi:hypothetical protein
LQIAAPVPESLHDYAPIAAPDASKLKIIIAIEPVTISFVSIANFQFKFKN